MKPFKNLLFLAALILAATGAFAQEKFDAETVSLDTGRMDAYLKAQAEILRVEASARIDSPEKLARERESLHREFIFMLGLDPLPPARRPASDYCAHCQA